MPTIIDGIMLVYFAVSAYVIWVYSQMKLEQQTLADEYAKLTKQISDVQFYLRGFYHDFDEYTRAQRWAPSAPMPQDPADQWTTDHHSSVLPPTRPMATVTPLIPRFRGGSHGSTNPVERATVR